MSATVRLFAGAAETVGRAEVQTEAANVATLVAELVELGDPGTAAVLDRCSVLVSGIRSCDGDAAIPDGAVVDVLPPFAGG